MPNELPDAGGWPAFTDYETLGTSYRILVEQFRTGQMTHAYLLSGPKGVGKATFARYLACALFCEGSPKPCGKCDGCRRVLDHNEADVIDVAPQDRKLIPIDQIREMLERIAQYANHMRVVVIEPIEKLTPQAQNCLLKSLEEPQANVIFLLLSHESSAVLGTIASRCSRMKLHPWSDAIIRQTCLKLGYGSEQIERAVPQASGNIGAAIALLNDREDAAMAFARQAMEVQRDADVLAISSRLKEERENADAYLDALELRLRQVTMVHAGTLPASAIADLPAQWSAGDERRLASLASLIQHIFEAREKRASQVNWQSTVDRLLMEILEEKTKWQQ